MVPQNGEEGRRKHAQKSRTFGAQQRQDLVAIEGPRDHDPGTGSEPCEGEAVGGDVRE
jgi:hypothetical protein